MTSRRWCWQSSLRRSRLRSTRASVGDLDGDVIELLDANTQQAVEQLASPHVDGSGELLLRLVQRIDLCEQEIAISIDLTALDRVVISEPVTITTPIGVVRSGKRVRLLVPPVGNEQDKPRNPSLLKLVVQALAARRQIEQGVPFENAATNLGYGKNISPR